MWLPILQKTEPQRGCCWSSVTQFLRDKAGTQAQVSLPTPVPRHTHAPCCLNSGASLISLGFYTGYQVRSLHSQRVMVGGTSAFQGEGKIWSSSLSSEANTIGNREYPGILSPPARVLDPGSEAASFPSPHSCWEVMAKQQEHRPGALGIHEPQCPSLPLGCRRQGQRSPALQLRSRTVSSFWVLSRGQPVAVHGNFSKAQGR